MSSGRCWSSEVYNPVPGVMEGVPSANGYQGGFGSQLMVKVRPCVRHSVPLFSSASASEVLEFFLSWLLAFTIFFYFRCINALLSAVVAVTIAALIVSERGSTTLT